MKKFILGIFLGVIIASIAVISLKREDKTVLPTQQNTVSAFDKIRGNRQNQTNNNQEKLQRAIENLMNMQNKEPKDIISSLDEILKYRPQDANLHALKAQMLQKQGNLPSALEAINKAISLDPQNPNYYQVRGEINFNFQDFDEAERDFTIAAQLSGKADNYYNRAVTNLNLGNYEAANQDFKKAQNLYKKEGNLGASLQAKNMSGLLTEGLKQNAQNQATQTNTSKNKKQTGKISDGKNKSKAQTNPAVNKNVMDKISKSLKHFSESETFSDFQELLPKGESAAALVEDVKASLDDVAPSFEQTVAEQSTKQPKISKKELLKDTPFESVAKAKKLVSQKDFEGATSVLDKAIEKNQDNEALYYNRAIANYQKGDYKSAFNDLNKVLELNSNNYQAALAKGDMYNSLGQTAQAKQAYQNAAELAAEAGNNKVAEDAQTKYQLLEGQEITTRTNQRFQEAANAFKRQEYDKAADLFKQIYQDNPDAGNAYNLGLAYQGQGKMKEASEMFKIAAEEKPKDLKIQQAAAIAIAQEKDYDTAKKYLTQGLEIDPDNPDLWALDAEISGSQENFTEMKNKLEGALDRYKQRMQEIQDEAEIRRMQEQIEKINSYLEQMEQAGI